MTRQKVRGLLHRQRFAAPLALLAFWCGMAAAAHRYPSGYDWPYQTISVLLYPDHNPRGYLWAWAGLELCGLAGLWWTTGAPKPGIAEAPAVGLRLLQLGFLFMCCTVLPEALLPLPKGHELFAILAFLGLCSGASWQMVAVVDGSGSDHGRRTRAGVSPLFRRSVPLLPLLPLVLAGLTQIYLALERPELPWVSPRWRTLGISAFLSFGLWEWISAAVLSISLLALWQRDPPVAQR